MWTELRHAFRALRRAPLYTAAAVVSLALGIGANTAIFSLLDQVLFRTLPVRAPGELVILNRDYTPNGWSQRDNNFAVYSYPLYRALRDSNPALSGVAARTSAGVNIAAGRDTERAYAEVVSGNYFDVLGVRAALGRLIQRDDDRIAGGHPVIVLSYSYWMKRFAGARDVLNRKVLVNGHPMTIIGVAAPRFRGVVSGQTPHLFVPIAMQRQVLPMWDALDNLEMHWLNLIGRVAPGYTRASAQAATLGAYRRVMAEEVLRLGPDHLFRSERSKREYFTHPFELVPAAQGINQLRGAWQDPLIALMAMVALVLLIACANLANLLLARGASRQREFAIRLAVGAGRWRLVREVLVESMIVALAGGLAGLLVATWTADALVRALPQDAAGGWLAATLDVRVLGFAFALSCLTGLIFGIVPALRGSRTELLPSLGNRTSAGAHAREGRLRRGLVAAQVALSLLLLVGAGLFVRSLMKLAAVDPGFRPERLVTFAVNPRLSGYDAERGQAFFTQLRARVAAIPGVTSVGAGNPGPLTNSNRGSGITVEGYQAKGDESPQAATRTVTPAYFRAIGTRLVAGREFTEADGPKSPQTVIVNQAFVKHYFTGSSPLGRHIALQRGDKIVPDREIVGVVADNKHGSLRDTPGPALFLPYTQDALTPMDFYVRTARSPSELAGDIRRVVRDLDASVPAPEIRPVQLVVDESMYAERLIAVLAAAFGVLATLLAGLGLYGVVAFTVARRTPEIGVRMALGGRPRDALLLVMRDVFAMIAAGVAAGLPAAWFGARLVESQLFGLRAHDPLIFGGAVAVLAAAAGLAGFLPARRASKVDPMLALRYE